MLALALALLAQVPPTSGGSGLADTVAPEAPLMATPQVHLALDGDDRGDAAQNDRLRGVLAKDLVEAGFIVVSDDDRASHAVAITHVGGAYAVSVSGAESRSVIVDDGTPSLTELELRHRVRSLVRLTAPASAVPVANAAYVVEAAARRRVVDASGALVVDDGDDVFVGAFVRAGADVADAAHAGARACFDADDVHVAASLGGDACDEVGFDVDAADAGDAARALLRLRGDTPPPPPRPQRPIVVVAPPVGPPPPPPLPVASLHLELGGMVRLIAIDAAVSAHLEVPVFDQGPFRYGGLLVVDASGTLVDIAVADVFVGVGPMVTLALTDRVRVSTGVAVGAWAHGWFWDGSDAGLAFDPAVVMPLHVVVPITRSLGVSLGVNGGFHARNRSHIIDDGRQVWARSAVFSSATGGVVFDW